MFKTFETTDPIELYVELPVGSLVVRAAGTATTELRIDGPRAEEFLVELNGRELSVIAPRGKFFAARDAHRVEVLLPEHSDLVTRTGSADTGTTGILEAVALKSGSGDIDVETAHGALSVESGSGDVRVQNLGADARIKSGSGDIRLGDARGKVGISTGSGDVQIVEMRQPTIVKTGSGDLDVRRTESDLSLSTASGDLVVAQAVQGVIVAKSATGDVRVGIPHGTPVWADLNTVTGSLDNRTESAGQPVDGQPHLEIRANTVSGDIHLTTA